MFDYFRNYSNNAHHVCCEDGLTKGLYEMTIASPMTLLKLILSDIDLDARSQWVSKGNKIIVECSRQLIMQ